MQTFARFVAANSRWLAGGFLMAFFSSFGQIFFIALSGGEFRRTFDLTNGEFGSLYMAATLLSAGTLPFLGRLLDRFSCSRSRSGHCSCWPLRPWRSGWPGVFRPCLSRSTCCGSLARE